MDIYERLLAICMEESSNRQHNIAMFDAIVARATQEGIVVNQAAMRLVRENCPNTVIVFEVDGELEYVEMYTNGTFDCSGYTEENFPELIPEHKAIEDCGSERLESSDLQHLRYVVHDGVKYYDENDIYDIIDIKETKRLERLESWRTATLDLPDEFLDLCDKYDLEPLTVLKDFIADVCGIVSFANNPRSDGYNSNGSDERDMAAQYFDRAHWNPDVQEKHGISYHY